MSLMYPNCLTFTGRAGACLNPFTPVSWPGALTPFSGTLHSPQLPAGDLPPFCSHILSEKEVPNYQRKKTCPQSFMSSQTASFIYPFIHLFHGMVYGMLQARIPEWVAFPFSRGSSLPKDRTQVSRIAGRFFTR